MNGRYIDLHTHGLGKFDTRSSSAAEIMAIAEAHAKDGTAAILPTIYSGPLDEMRRNMQAVSDAMALQAGAAREEAGAAILGMHLEGPFLNPVRSGALRRESFITPSVPALKRLIADYEEQVRIITLAPELKGALKVIETCRAIGIRVNMGHSDATLRQALEAKKAGAAGVTHIFNAMRPLHHREPGLAGLGLMDEDLYIEVIGDGMHLHPQTLKLIFRCKRPDRIILISDSVRGSRTAKGVVYEKGILAGSGLTLGRAVRQLALSGISDSLIGRAARINPLRYLGI